MMNPVRSIADEVGPAASAPRLKRVLIHAAQVLGALCAIGSLSCAASPSVNPDDSRPSAGSPEAGPIHRRLTWAQQQIVERDRGTYEEITRALPDGGVPSARFYNDSDGYTVGRWHRWTAATEAQARESMDTLELFSVEGRIRKVDRWFTSLSGDWEHSDDLYYDREGRLAFCLEQVVTYNGMVEGEDAPDAGSIKPFLVELRHWFDAHGTELKQTRHVFSKPTGRELRDAQVQEQDHDEELYRRVTDLPVPRR